MDIFQILQTIFTGFTVIVAIVAVAIAYQIGKKQNEINIQALGLQDFAEVFLMPQIVYEEKEGSKYIAGWNLLVLNASSYPVYLNKYTFNNKEEAVGDSVIPNHPETWYQIPIPKGTKEFTISIEFEDYRGKRYKTDGRGIQIGSGWSIHSNRRVELR